MPESRIRLETTPDPGVVYLKLSGYPDAPSPGIVVKTLGLETLLPDYKGSQVYLDFNESGELIGIEILERGD